MNDYRRQIVLDICNSFFRQDFHVHRMATGALEAIESGTGYVRGAVILNGDENRPTRLFAHSRRGIVAERFNDDMRNVNRLLASEAGAGVVRHTLVDGSIQVVQDVEENDVYVPADERVSSEFCAPLVHRGAVFGAMNIEALEKSAFDQADVTLLSTIAVQLSLFLRSTTSERELVCHNGLLNLYGDAVEGG